MKRIMIVGQPGSGKSTLARAEVPVGPDRDWPLGPMHVLRRSWINRGRVRPDLPDGCPETSGARTVEFVRFIWRTRHRSRATLARDATDTGKTVVHPTSDQAATDWLVALGFEIPPEWH